MALTLRRIEGFDGVDTATRAKAMDTSAGSSCTIASPGAAGSGNYQRMTGSGSRCGYTIPSVALGDRVVVGFAVYFEQGDFEFFRLLENDGTSHVDLNLNASSLIEARRNDGAAILGTGTTTIALNTWYYLEVEVVIGDANGSVRVLLGGSITDISLSSVDTRNGGTGLITTAQWLANTSRAFRIDDIYVGSAPSGDTPGAAFLSLVDGPPRVSYLTPSAAGNYAQWTPSASTNVSNVDDAAPDDDTTYNETDVANEIDSFVMTDLPGAGVVHAVQSDIYARKTDAGARFVSELYRIASTDYPGSDQPLSTTYAYQRQLRTVSPATAAAWTVAELNGLEAGYKAS